MNIRVNDQPREVVADTALAELARVLGLGERKGVAIALNDEVVPRAAWAGRKLIEGDRVLVIQATQGG
ncbi:MAG: sulfur carrier protein ThiS [Opitutus sp.]|nr:sulfur carrier protein ThiS [Opitutus sp.]MCS6246658.1 sulfur carrier protein ThiS [Opitutus sp.]MCS6272819.1 sulfur carrier protein ThiS [Opitutus sp.]MCS6278817.1 sulfur carrier protein ThiS [Opitutus sp.]MCS6299605.1 sulfur carrier protein ThiS [Opitutus sp.]